jgi:hypothetical protein
MVYPLPTLRRPTPIATTGSLPFRIGVGTDGVMSVQLIT